MKTENFIENERKGLKKMLDFRLPNVFKSIGLLIAIIAFLLLVFKGQLAEDVTMLRSIARQGLIIGLLLISLSRDKEEDEMTVQLRAQSYAMGFIVGVLYALTMPYVEYGVANVIKSEGKGFSSLGDFQLLAFMLLVQLMFYHVLKRFR